MLRSCTSLVGRQLLVTGGSAPAAAALTAAKVPNMNGNGGEALFDVPRRYRVRRILMWPTEPLPFQWTYPAKKDNIRDSGDQKHALEIRQEQLSKPKTPFNRLPELETAPDAIKKIFSIGFAMRVEQRESLRDQFIDRVRRHPYDTQSLEYRIADKTFKIRAMKETFNRGFNRRDKFLKTKLHEAIDMRNKLLKYLGRQDQERYQFVKEQLEIDHTPFPLGQGHQKITRKGELRRLVEEYVAKLKEKKLAAYHEQLKVLQKQFEVEKTEAEAWISKEIAELQLTDEEVKSLEYEGSIK